MYRKMEANVCDKNHLDADVLLPPRKRLLAGLKKQNFDVNSFTYSPAPANSEFDTRLSRLSKFHLSDPNCSNEEIFEAARLEAIEAEKFAKAARAIAEEKAAKAVKAMAAAKIALEWVAIVSDKVVSGDKYLKKNKMQKHVHVRAKDLDDFVKEKDLTGADITTSNTNRADRTKTGNGKALQSSRVDCINMETGEGEIISSKEKFGKIQDDICSIGKTKGSHKQKKLALSICTSRDQTSHKENTKSKSTLSPDEYVKGNASNKSMFPVERTSMWKCQTFKTPAFVKQNEVMHS